MFNAKRPPSYFLDTLFGCCCLGEYTKAAEDVCPRPLYYLQFSVCSLLFCTEIYSHTSLMLMSLMAVPASPPVS